MRKIRSVLAETNSSTHLKVWRLFLNATTHPGIRSWIRKQNMMCQMISEGIASCLGRIRAKDQIAPAELESVLGVVINLTLDEHFIEQLQQHGAMGLLKDSLTVSATPGCTSRALAAAARIARHAAAADDAIRVGVFDMFLEKLKRLRETPADDLDHCVRGVAQCLKVTGASAGRRLMQEEGVLEARAPSL
mmetsp:Transcript_47613/g.149232  ORF Transcript_47613/g.149232 Transcript_47613/m.149232 type:complete len:191 (-) Transcript_47613:485-1057(-)